MTQHTLNDNLIQALQARFQGAIRFLEKINQLHLPWYLMIGPKSAGKTTLLANSNISFTLAKKFQKENIHNLPSSETCDWWVTQQLVLIDVPSHLTQLRKEPQPPLWRTLLSLIRQHRAIQMPQGLVIAIPLPELMQSPNPQQLKHLTAEIKQRIQEVYQTFGTIPCHFIMTKCDLIPGFSDFFCENSKEEAEQFWGITFPAQNKQEKNTDILSRRFNALINRINKQLIWRLHQERNPVARILIKDFPLQIERIKDVFTHFIKSLNISQLKMNTVFLTSAIQPELEETHVTFNQHNQTALQLLQSPIAPTKPYFIRDVISKGLLHVNSAPQSVTLQNKKSSNIAYHIAALAIISTAILFSYDFKQGASQAYAIRHNLEIYQSYVQQTGATNDHITKLLPLLNSLKQAAEKSHPYFSAIKHFAFYTKRSNQTAQDIYQSALQTLLLPEIKYTEEFYLQQSVEKNPIQLYHVLKAYLMLTNVSEQDPSYVAQIINQINSTSLSETELKELNAHLTNLFAILHPVNLNQEIIVKSRKQFESLPRTDLAYIILKSLGNNNSDSKIQLGTDTQVFVSQALTGVIPNMFTADGFQSILNGGIQTAAAEASAGNWILGELPPAQSSDLEAQLQSEYVSNYIDIWESQLANIKLNTPKNLSELNNILSIITSDHSPLLQLLKTISYNTSFGIITATSPKLQNLNALLAESGKEDNQLYQMFLSMRELHFYVQHIAESHDVGNAAFMASKLHAQKTSEDPISRMVALSHATPEPMKDWLTDLSTSSWQLISNTAAHYIDITLANKAPTARKPLKWGEDYDG